MLIRFKTSSLFIFFMMLLGCYDDIEYNVLFYVL